MEFSIPAPSLVVLVGPSGSGKTTWAKEHFVANEVVSSDALRGMVGAGEDDQTASTAAFDLLERIIAERMRRGLTTVVDTLGMDSGDRARWVGLARDSGIPAHAIAFDTDPALCEERNAARVRSIPKAALSKQISRFKTTRGELADEDFDEVHLVTDTSPSPAPQVLHRPTGDTRAEAGIATTAPPRHTFGLIVSRFDWESDLGPTLASIAQRAESAGFRDVWVMDHFRQIRGVGRAWEDIPEAYAALGFMAGATSTVRMGAMVTGITHRHPVVLGKMVASLDVLSGGRAICGLGIGWDQAEHASYGIEFPDVSSRYEIIEEALQMLPLLWGKGTPRFEGNHLQAEELICYPRPIQDPIPILIGGGGEKKTLRLVARYANACNVFGDPERVRRKVEVLHRHCEETERDPSDIEVTHLTNAMAGANRKTLRERVEALRDRSTTAEAFMNQYNAGTADDLEEVFSRYAEAGADHSIVALPDVSKEGSIEAFGEVIARFEGA